jgi:hypothetical protein
VTEIALRPPDVVMRFARLGASHPTRLSFLRSLIRRAARERWAVRHAVWNLDDDGFGQAVYVVDMPARRYSLVAFSTPLDPSNRTDRVIAQAWDTSYVLYDGVPDANAVQRLATNVPLQEAGRFTASELVLARANKSVRLFESVVEALARGEQPDAAALRDVGYLMRTTAVYGNGKFGISDRDEIAHRPELAGPFQAEMLTVWLIRTFTMDLADHIAHRRNPAGAVRLDPRLRRALGVGNATGLGMAPYLVRHPVLVHHWFHARESALARVRSLPSAGRREREDFTLALAALRDRIRHWHTADAQQAGAIAILAQDLAELARNCEELLGSTTHPWDALYRFAERHFSLEGQEACVALMLEPHGSLVDDLADTMAADESAGNVVDGRMRCGALKALVEQSYAWARRFDFKSPAANARFWYVSAEKLEPRLGERFEEDGAELEQPLAIARDATALADALALEDPGTSVADFLLLHPEWRQMVRRAQMLIRFPYSEIRDNLVDAGMRPIDLLRSKLAFFGARNFDPRSDRWVRIALFAGEPLVEEIDEPDPLGVAT